MKTSAQVADPPVVLYSGGLTNHPGQTIACYETNQKSPDRLMEADSCLPSTCKQTWTKPIELET